MRFTTNKVERISDMKWFTCIDPNHPAMIEALESVGQNGCWQIILVTSEALGQGVSKLDSTMVSKWAGVKRDRAEKILPFAQKILEESLKISPKSQKISENLPEISKNVEEISENLVDFNASSPDGSTRAHAPAHVLSNINNKYKNINNTDQEFSAWYAAYPHKVGKGQAEKAYATARKRATAEQLLEGLERYKKNKPDYAAWRNPATWLNGLGWEDEYTKPETTAAPNKTEFEKLFSFPYVGSNANGKVYKPEQLRMDEAQSNIVWSDDGAMHYIGNLKGLMEKPAHVV